MFVNLRSKSLVVNILQELVMLGKSKDACLFLVKKAEGAQLEYCVASLEVATGVLDALAAEEFFSTILRPFEPITMSLSVLVVWAGNILGCDFTSLSVPDWQKESLCKGRDIYWSI